ncbi:MAG: type II toxin-antitoxin system RelE/ParE family toxin [Candidatus Gracilibacteria bacterium]|jgi:mRNA interferase RelE/StbE|nr:type II toxin-antitoxin system RelE/ParE family toxin [Candidatus Gracilibacteria bacterium]
MAYKLVYSSTAEKDLERIDRVQSVKILKKVNEYIGLDNPLVKAKKLKGFDVDTFRFRVGDYRVIFRLDEKTKILVVLVVLTIAHRKVVYKKITKSL